MPVSHAQLWLRETARKLFGLFMLSSLLLEPSIFMVLSRRPEEQSAAAGNHSSSIGLGCCQQNRWPMSGAVLTAVSIQKVHCAKQDQAGPSCILANKKGMLCGKGACIYLERADDHVPQWVGKLKYDKSS